MKYKRSREKTILGILFILPVCFLVVLFIVYPFLSSFYLSFYKWDGFNPLEFVGLKNFWKILFKDEVFRKALFNTLKLALFSTFFSTLIGLIMADVVFFSSRKIGTALRTIFFTPAIIPLTAVAILWAFIYNPSFGLLNTFLRSIGLQSLTRAWLGETRIALLSVILVSVWKYFGFNMVLYFTGYQMIPTGLFEAAKLDGAGRIQSFFHITFPLLLPITQVVVVLNLVLSLKTFDLVYVMTQGGPGRATITMSMWIVENAFRYYSFGYGAALGVLLFVVVFVVANLGRWMLRERG